MRIASAVLVGVGGTGSHLLEPLARLLAFHPSGPGPDASHGLVLVDGDRFEASNHGRQLGCEPGAFKVYAMKARAKPLLRTHAVPMYVDETSFGEVLDGTATTTRLLVILAVDNHATRRQCLLALRARNYPTALVLSPGNDLAHGNVIAWARVGGLDVTPYPLGRIRDSKGGEVDLYPELVRPADRPPGGCAKLAPSTPQLITANAFAATIALAYVQAWLDDQRIAPRTEFGSPDRWKIGVRASGTDADLVDLRAVRA